VGYTRHWAITEVVLDPVEQCAHCGRAFDAIHRVYAEKTTTHGHGIIAALTNAASRAEFEAQFQARRSAVQGAGRAVPLHRCTHCERYCDGALELMRDAYRTFRFRRRALRWLLWIPALCLALLSALGLLGYVLAVRASAPGPPVVGAVVGTGIMVLAGVFLFLAGRRVGSSLPDKYESRVKAANAPDRVARWLRNWNRYAPRLIDRLLSPGTALQTRPWVWGRIHWLQHRADTVPERWVARARQDPLGAVLARARG